MSGQLRSCGSLLTFAASEDVGSWVIDSTSHALLGVISGVANGGRRGALRAAYKILDSICKVYSGAQLPPRPSSSNSTGPPPGEASREEKKTVIIHFPFFKSDFSLGWERASSAERSDTAYQAGKPQLYLEHDETGSSKKFFGLYRGSQPNSYADGTNRGKRLDRMIGDQWRVWELDGQAKMAWECHVQPQVRMIIHGSLSTSSTVSTPILSLRGLMLCNKSDDRQAVPTVTIACGLREYRTQLRRSIRRSGVLEANRFDMMTMNTPVRLERE